MSYDQIAADAISQLAAKDAEIAAMRGAVRAKHGEIEWFLEVLAMARDELTEPTRQGEDWRALMSNIDAALQNRRDKTTARRPPWDDSELTDEEWRARAALEMSGGVL